MLSHSDQCSYKIYKCEFSSYPHAEHINQRCIPCQPDLIHIPAGLLQGEPVVIKQDRYAELVKTQQVQQHGTKVMTREDWRERERCLFKSHCPQHANEDSFFILYFQGARDVHFTECKLKEGVDFYSFTLFILACLLNFFTSFHSWGSFKGMEAKNLPL